jgi:NADH-quinone oxidoreductase subunit D
MDRIAGHRFTVSHARIGGVANDLTDEATALYQRICEHISKRAQRLS